MKKTSMYPKLAMCSNHKAPRELKALALANGFSGIDWSFDLDAIPVTPAAESDWAKDVHSLFPLEIRYHCPFYRMDLGADNPDDAQKAETVFQRIIRLVSKAGGKFLSIHIGLGHDTTVPLSWDRTVDNLQRLGAYAARRGVTLCLENLAWGWTSRPHLFEKLIRGSGVGVTFDIGHAYVSEAVRSRYYEMEDFVSPHADRVYNAHVYHEEVEGTGHVPPSCLEELSERLDLLQRFGCTWWVLEVHDDAGMLQTKRIVDTYLTQLTQRRTSADQAPFILSLSERPAIAG